MDAVVGRSGQVFEIRAGCLYSIIRVRFANVLPWLFSFINFQLIRLTASLGFEARYLIVSETAVYPANRNTDNAVLRIAAMTCGMAPHRTGEVSSPSTVSRI